MRKVFLLLVVLGFLLAACEPGATLPSPPDEQQVQAEAAEQLSTEARAAANSSGPSIEARNVAERIKRTNLPGHVGFIYFVSPYTGEIIMKATFVGKPTSTSKRLDPPQKYEQLTGVDVGESYASVFLEYESVSADGTYGGSMPGIFWFTTDGQMMESRGDASVILILERPYVFAENRVDMTVDVRLQSEQIDQTLEAQALAVEEYIKNTPGWKIGDPIPVEVLNSAGGQ